MLKLIRYLKQVKWPILAIILLLVVQAWCDLSLPQYTSDIGESEALHGRGRLEQGRDRLHPG